MFINIVIDYMVLDTAKYLGLVDELVDYANELADTWSVSEVDHADTLQVRIGRLNFKRRPIIAERSNHVEIRLERLG